ncbi:MAG TPA: hypothetical protein DEP27_03085 [Ruminococcaceae bacterium]|jgi:HSP20 family protein|nr:hypothetical protein [Oscillospiraceae bacterium]
MLDFIPFEDDSISLFDFLNNFDNTLFHTPESSLNPCRMDIRDDGDNYVVEAELPGFTKEEISLSTEGCRLTLTAQHKGNGKEESSSKYIHRERRVSSLRRSFDISNIDANQIHAKFENGILSISLPKEGKEKALAKQISIL